MQLKFKTYFYLIFVLPMFLIQPWTMDVWSAEPSQGLHSLKAKPVPEWLTQGVMYQIFLRSFTHDGTLNAATERLPKVAELGADIIYLCPVNLQDDDTRLEFWSPRQKASGANNPKNPYRIKDYYSIDPEYGTKKDLRKFIEKTHELDMRLLLDLVYLHCGPTSVLMQKHPEYLKHDADGNVLKGNWNFPVLDFSNKECREYLLDNMQYWVEDFNVDGFRCDVSSGIPLDFWEEARERLESIRPGLVLLAEGERKRDQIKAFDISYSFTWMKAIHDVFLRGKPASFLHSTWEKMRKERPTGVRFIRYTENHDIVNNELHAEVVFSERGSDAVSVMNFMLDGVPMLYNGQEIGDTTPQSIFIAWPIRWEAECLSRSETTFSFYQKLCKLRQNEPALYAGEVIWLDNDQPDSTISFLRRADTDEILTVVSLTNRPAKVVVDCHEEFRPSLSSAAKFSTVNGKLVFELGPFGYFIGKR